MESHLIFLSHSAVDTEAAIQLAKRIESAGDSACVRVWLDKTGIVPGKPWLGQLQAALAESSAFAVYIGSKGVANWVWDEVAAALERAHREPAYPVIPILAPGIGADTLPSFLSQYQCVQNIEADPEAFASLLRAATRQRAASFPVEPEPFQGLEAFGSSRAHLFFGREADTKSVVDLLRLEHLVMVVGDSGSGKSSLVKAGVAPQFLGGSLARREERRAEDIVWQVLETRPSNSPFEQLADTVRQLALRQGYGPKDASELADLVRARRGSKIRDAVRMAACPAGQSNLRVHVLLIVDQFEELFTLAPADAQEAFATALLELAGDSMWLILTMRWDYYALMSAVPALRERLEGSERRARFGLRRMSDESLRRCVTGPLELAGVEKDKSDVLATAVLSDVGDRPNQLALLEMALQQTWAKRQQHGGDLLRSYVAIGRVDGALAKAADEALSMLSPEERARAESLFIRLVKLGDAGGATRRIAERAELSNGRWELAQKLADKEHHRLIAVSETAVEISHEAIVTSWPQYAAWLRNDSGKDDLRADDKRLLDVLADDARRWLRREKDSELLARGTELAEYEALRRRRSTWLAPREQEFISDGARALRGSQLLRTSARVALATLFLLLVGSLSAVSALWLRSPTAAWTEIGLEGVTPRLIGIVSTSGKEVIRAAVQYHEKSLDDDSGGTGHIVVLELELSGRVLGCFAYAHNEGYFLEDGDCESRGGFGSLADEHEELARLEFDSERDYGELLLRNRINPQRLPEPRDGPVVAAAAAAVEPGRSDGEKEARRKIAVFSLGDHRMLAFVTIESSTSYERTVPMTSDDDGSTWTLHSVVPQLSGDGVEGLASATADGRTLLLATRDNRVYADSGYPGALFRSDDAGATWSRVMLSGDWQKWQSFSGIAANDSSPGELVLALSPVASSYDVRPRNVPGVLLSSDAAKTWRALEAGLRVTPDTVISLAGRAKSGEIVAVLADGQRSSQGRIAVWRRLTFLERLLGRY